MGRRRETEQSSEELSQPLPEHEALREKAADAAKGNEAYRSNMKWDRVIGVQKALVIVAVYIEIGACYV